MKSNVDKLEEINTALSRARAEASNKRLEADTMIADVEAWARQEMERLPRAYHTLVELGGRTGQWLVEDWRQAWKWISVQAMAVAVLFPTVLSQLPDRYQNSIPDRWVLRITIALVVIGIIGRMVKQPGAQK